MGRQAMIGLWVAAVLAGGLFAAQTVWAERNVLTPRLLLNAAAASIGALLVWWIGRRGESARRAPAPEPQNNPHPKSFPQNEGRTSQPALLPSVKRGGRGQGMGGRSMPGAAVTPEPIALILIALAALSLWAVAWWVMDLSNYVLEDLAGPIPRPQPIILLADKLFGLDTQAAAYEVQILFSVAVLPLVQGGLLWGLIQPGAAQWIGRRRAAWLAGTAAGVLWTLTAVQNIAPALPWGLASLGGWLLIGWLAAWAVYLTGSAWAGITAHGVFAYASFAWRDDLFRQFAGRDYFDVAWLTVLVLGVFVAIILMQVVRFRSPRPDEPPRAGGNAFARLGVPLALLIGLGAVLAVLDIDARQTEQNVREAATGAAQGEGQ